MRDAARCPYLSRHMELMVIPLEMRRSLPNDGWNESMDCVVAAEAKSIDPEVES